MKHVNWFRLVAVAPFAAGAAYFIAIYPLLPERIAIHYNFAGEADGWGDKSTFALVMGVAMAGVNVLLFGAVPLLSRWMPASAFNFPTRRQKAYWTATPERFAAAKRKMLNALPIVALPVNLLVLSTTQITYQANVEHPALRVPAGPVMQAGAALVLAGAAVMTIWLLRSLRIPPGAQP